MQTQPKRTYTPGIIAEILSWPEVAVTFRNVAQIGLGYYCGGDLYIGSFNPKTGTIKSHAFYSLMPSFSDEEALRMLEQERDRAFPKEFAPSVALVVNGQVKVRGEHYKK